MLTTILTIYIIIYLFKQMIIEFPNIKKNYNDFGYDTVLRKLTLY